MLEQLPPVHPGEVLAFDFLEPMGLSQNALAIELGIASGRVNEIVKGKRAVTADTALRLSRYFGTTAGFWLNLQTRYDLDVAEAQLAGQLDRIRPRVAVGA